MAASEVRFSDIPKHVEYFFSLSGQFEAYWICYPFTWVYYILYIHVLCVYIFYTPHETLYILAIKIDGLVIKSHLCWSLRILITTASQAKSAMCRAFLIYHFRYIFGWYITWVYHITCFFKHTFTYHTCIFHRPLQITAWSSWYMKYDDLTSGTHCHSHPKMILPTSTAFFVQKAHLIMDSGTTFFTAPPRFLGRKNPSPSPPEIPRGRNPKTWLEPKNNN